MNLEIRPVILEDGALLAEWISDPLVEPDFPMGQPQEIEEGAKRWVELACEQKSGLVAVYEGAPVGLGMLFLQTYKLILHNCVHILVIAPPYREIGIGKALLEALEKLAKERGVDLLHVEGYDDEEAIRFYRGQGYTEFGRQEAWTKTDAGYRGRVLLEKFI